MPVKIFISYARADGVNAAARLRIQLERAGYIVWRDIEDMQGGKRWKEQLRAALREVEVILVLLTPRSVKSKMVEHEWNEALALQKQVIPLLILPCNVPSELAELHYHNLSTSDDYVLGFAALIRDLEDLRSTSKMPPQANHLSLLSTSVPQGDTYTVYQSDRSAVGRGATVINYSDVSSSGLLYQLIKNLDSVQDFFGDEFEQIRQGLTLIYSRIDQSHHNQIIGILNSIYQNQIQKDELQFMLENIKLIVEGIQTNQLQIGDDLQIAVENLHTVTESDLSLQQKVELTLPIIPFFLDYKAEFTAGSHVDLDIIWNELKLRWNKLVEKWS